MTDQTPTNPFTVLREGGWPTPKPCPEPSREVPGRCTCTEPTYGWVEGPSDAERVMCKVCGGQYYPELPSREVPTTCGHIEHRPCRDHVREGLMRGRHGGWEPCPEPSREVPAPTPARCHCCNHQTGGHEWGQGCHCQDIDGNPRPRRGVPASTPAPEIVLPIIPGVSGGRWGNGDVACPNDGEPTNYKCWKCGWVRRERPASTPATTPNGRFPQCGGCPCHGDDPMSRCWPCCVQFVSATPATTDPLREAAQAVVDAYRQYARGRELTGDDDATG